LQRTDGTATPDAARHALAARQPGGRARRHGHGRAALHGRQFDRHRVTDVREPDQQHQFNERNNVFGPVFSGPRCRGLVVAAAGRAHPGGSGPADEPVARPRRRQGQHGRRGGRPQSQFRVSHVHHDRSGGEARTRCCM